MRSIVAALLLLSVASPASAQERAVPYWASIASGQAMMRTGPERTYPGIWLYQRRDLPVQVVQVHKAWRRVRERDGTTGWMLASLLSARRTAVVTGRLRAIRERPEPGAALMWQAEPGVIGRIDQCGGGWCRIDAAGHVGFIETGHLWGVGRNEAVD